MQYSNTVHEFKRKTPHKKPFQQQKKILLTGIALTGLLAVLVMQAPHLSPDSQVDWLSRLANAGDDGAQLQLGLAYTDGQYGLAPDKKAGQYWLKAAASNGNVYAQDYLVQASAGTASAAINDKAGRMQHFWQRIEQDFPDTQTAEALQGHARQGDPVAEYQLAMRYRDGAWAVKKNAKQSMYWLQRAAADGNPVALKDIAAMHQASLIDKTSVRDKGGHV